MKSTQLPLILLSGMGADERVFSPQKAAFDNLTVPEWLEPLPRESLAAYAKRMAAAVDPAGPCFLGGASFGGMVAMEMSRHLDVRAVILVGSVRGPQELPRLVRACPIWLAIFARFLPCRFVQFCCRGFRRTTGRFLHPFVRGILSQLEHSDASFLRWAMFAMLVWRDSGDSKEVPVFQIHGERDRALPVKNTVPTSIVRGGGHVISLTHAEEVNMFLRETMLCA